MGVEYVRNIYAVTKQEVMLRTNGERIYESNQLTQVHVGNTYRKYRVGQKNGLFMRVDNFATVGGRNAWYVKI